MTETDLVQKAINLACSLHEGQEKYNKRIPYIAHVLAVTRLVSIASQNPEVIAAAALHDAIEKGGMSENGLREKFGKKTASIVAQLTEPAAGDWKSKKENLLDRIRKTKDNNVLLVACADKADNLYNQLLLQASGTARFTQKEEKEMERMKWYHHSALEIFRKKPLFRKNAASAILISYENWYRDLFAPELGI